MNINTREYDQIMQIKVSSSELVELLTRVKSFISCNTKFYIVTPNPELVLMAQGNEKLKNALNSADISIPDGVGLKLALPSLKIIKGRKFFLELIKLAAGKGWKVFFLGGLGNEAEIASQKLQITNNKLQIRFNKGPMLGNDAEPATEGDKKLESEAITQINSFKPELLFVAFGNPKQEIWIHKNLSKLNIGGAMAVGGTLRYVAGLSKLPPKWMEKLGLEWLFRLVTEPKRIERIFNAVIIFPLKVLWSKLTS
jgi:N-acetylglucosaminyldiphosphoundecaprenol N-acetyl-beta-D-mannosaminyltransferase